MTSYQKSNSPEFSGENAAKGSARTEKESGGQKMDGRRKKEKEREGGKC